MLTQIRLSLIAAATSASALALIACGSASASEPGGIVHVYDVNTGTPTGSVVVTGAIGDFGTDQSNVSPNANRLVLSRGTFEVNTSEIQKKFSSAKAAGNSTNCGVVLAATAPATLFNGTGAYKGIAGKVTLTIASAAVLPRLANGKCNESPNSTALGEVTISQGSGTVSFK